MRPFNPSSRTLPHACLALVLIAAGIAPAGAQKEGSAYPSKTVTLISPFSPGASTDTVARLIAQKLADAWGQAVVVDNRTGAAGNIGLAAVARAPADGYTLGMIIVTHATNAAMSAGKPPFDLTRDFTPISQVVSQPYMLSVNPSMPVRSVKELIALAKARPGAITYGSSGVGSVLHLAGELLAQQGGVKLTHIAYKGAAPALVDAAGGHIAMVFSTRMSSLALVKSGRLRTLAVTTAERSPGAPELPTMSESGVPGPYDVNGWYGIGGPAGLPAALVERLNQDINRVLKLPDVQEKMLAEGTLPVGGTPGQFGNLIRTEVEKWRRTIQQAGIPPALP